MFNGIPACEKESVEELRKDLIEFCCALGASIDENDIDVAHRLSRKSRLGGKLVTDRSAVLVRFVCRWKKIEVQRLCRQKKPKASLMSRHGAVHQPVYANDHLSPMNADIFRKLRKLKGLKQIYDTRSYDCRVQLRMDESTQWIDAADVKDLQKLLSQAN